MALTNPCRVDKWCSSLEQQPMNDSSRSNHYEPSNLRLGCPIFLSHSGNDKDFVSILDQALCRRGYKVFFDKEILPKAVPVSMANILGEAKNCCKLGLLVLSDDFFEHTRNPMLELAAFVEHKVDLLPLFYKLSVEEFKEENRRERWYNKWRAWGEPENVIAQWKDALRMINTINGMEFRKEAPDRNMYINIIADKVCEILPIDLSHINESFQGKQRLCEFVMQMFESVEDKHQTESHMADKDKCSQLMDTRKYPGHSIQHVVRHNLVAGVHGFGGTGKSSLCKALNDYYFPEFRGRVCHIEMGSDSGRLSRRTKLLSFFDNHLSRTRLHGEEQEWNLLRENIRLSTRPIFLSIDNVAEESIDEAEEYLKCGPFPKGSKIFITSRTLEMLQRVTRHDKSCVWAEMPSLDLHEARDVFLHEMGCAIQQGADSMVNQCVRLCTLNVDKVDFHPLMLISLAKYIVAKTDILDPLMLKGIVAELSSDRRSRFKRVFKILDLTYRDLSQDEKNVYIDLALYGSKPMINDAKSWLKGLYDNPSNKVDQILRKLATSSLIRIGDDVVSMHDLLKDFAKKKVEDELTSIPRFVLENSGVECADKNLLALEGNTSYIKVAISGCVFRPNTTLDLSEFDRLEVLHLWHNKGINKIVLSREVFQRKLRSLIVYPSFSDSPFTITLSLQEEISARGKQKESMNRLFWIYLKNCKIKKENGKRFWKRAFPWSPNQSIAFMAFKRLVSLRMTDMPGLVLDNLGEFPLLEELYLDGVAVKAGSINCPRLKSLDLRRLTNVKTISGLEKSPSLQVISIFDCRKLQSLSIPDTDLVITACPGLERIDFCLTGEEVRQKQPRWYIAECEHLNELVRGECKLYLAQGVQTVRKPACDLIESVGTDSSVNRVNLDSFKLNRGESPGFPSLHSIDFTDAQHISHLISALHVGNVSHLEHLSIWCTRKSGGCGCDVGPPAFDLLGGGPKNLFYSCYHVRDLSSLGECGSVEHLDLSWCTSVERWPEFEKMSSLSRLGLSHTSLSQWPAIFEAPWRVQLYGISGCINLPCKELLKPMFLVPPPAMEEDVNSTGECLRYQSTLRAVLQAVRYDIRQKTRDWFSVVEAMRPNSVLLRSMLLQKRWCAKWGYDQRGMLSRLLYDVLASSESDCYSRFGYGYPAVSCEEARIVSFLKPLLAAREVVTAFLQEFLNVPASQRWTIYKTVKACILCGDDVLRRSEHKTEQLNLVLVGLVSIKMFNISVDEGLADAMAQIVQSFVSCEASMREDRTMSAIVRFMRGEHAGIMTKRRVYYYELLVMRVKEAVCRLASVGRVAEKLGESFMSCNIYPLQARVAQKYARLDGSLFDSLGFQEPDWRKEQKEYLRFELGHNERKELLQKEK